MAETRIADVVTPSVFTSATLEPSIYRSRFFRSGAMALNPAMSSLLNGGGKTYDLPFFKDISGTSGDIPAEGSDVTINNITSGQQVFRKQQREKAWGTNNLATILSGEDPLGAIQSYVVDYWAQAFDIMAIKTIEGVIADNVANDSGDLVNDVSGNSGSASYISDDAIIDAESLLGENGGISPDNSMGNFSAVLMHPKTRAYLKKLDLIDEVPISGQLRTLSMYQNKMVIEDRNATLATDVYSTYLLKPGFLQYGVGTSGYVPTEVDRDPKPGFGEDQLFTRRVFGIHPMGFSWQESSIAGTSPTDAELDNAVEWDRVYNAENSGIVVVKHKLPA